MFYKVQKRVQNNEGGMTDEIQIRSKANSTR